MDIPGKKKEQGKDRHNPPGRQPISSPTTRANIAQGGEKGQMYSQLHQCFFTSLGILLPANADPYKARVWPDELFKITVEGNEEQMWKLL
jgi:hypothetical protein